ncbi:hypothetical protein [Vibrio algivorus]|uniref:Uncharacterized protein n=1 Tax=Vibrio algivorus TaxID=1667024 RepID=A0A557PGY7_9VIBR|nr:hypothetical protein [Vibrio algivorus]TVO39918.1 hypothetical protein FOF44_00155 [Vibrio algivorus]
MLFTDEVLKVLEQANSPMTRKEITPLLRFTLAASLFGVLRLLQRSGAISSEKGAGNFLFYRFVTWDAPYARPCSLCGQREEMRKLDTHHVCGACRMKRPLIERDAQGHNSKTWMYFEYIQGVAMNQLINFPNEPSSGYINEKLQALKEKEKIEKVTTQ